MYTIAKNFLEYLNTTKVEDDERWGRFHFPKPADDFLNRVYDHDIWDGEFRSKIDDIRKKKIDTLNKSEILTYFTAIICIERTFNGFFREHAENGVLKALLKRYILLCDTEKEDA